MALLYSKVMSHLIVMYVEHRYYFPKHTSSYATLWKTLNYNSYMNSTTISWNTEDFTKHTPKLMISKLLFSHILSQCLHIRTHIHVQNEDERERCVAFTPHAQASLRCCYIGKGDDE